MKIIGFIGIDDRVEMVLKGDSCLLNNRKPFFLPPRCKKMHVNPCIVLRISRLGKHIAPKFAHRYYDGFAPGADFTDAELLQEARKTGGAWTQAIAFDYSLAVGEMSSEEPAVAGLLAAPEEAIARASQVMTLRQGDLIYIQYQGEGRLVQQEDVIEAEGLYCKIK